MWEPRSWICTSLEVQHRVLSARTGESIRLWLVGVVDSLARVVLAHLYTQSMEFLGCALDSPSEVLSPGLALLARVRELLEDVAAIRHTREVGPQSLPHLKVISEGLIGSGYDGLPDRLPLSRVGIKESRTRLALVHVGNLPRQVEGILDARVTSEAVKGRVSVNSVAQAEAMTTSLACSGQGAGARQ